MLAFAAGKLALSLRGELAPPFGKEDSTAHHRRAPELLSTYSRGGCGREAGEPTLKAREQESRLCPFLICQDSLPSTQLPPAAGERAGPEFTRVGELTLILSAAVQKKTASVSHLGGLLELTLLLGTWGCR